MYACLGSIFKYWKKFTEIWCLIAESYESKYRLQEPYAYYKKHEVISLTYLSNKEFFFGKSN